MLIRPDVNDARENEAGLIIPNNVELEQKSYGIVEAIGEEIKGVKVGDKVIYGTYAGESISFNENGKEVEFKLVFDEDVIAFLK